MREKRKKIKKPKDLNKKIQNLRKDLEKSTYSLEDLKQIEDFHKKISYISPDDLLKPFTI